MPKNDGGGEMWPPIHIKGETLSFIELTNPVMDKNCSFLWDSVPLEQITTVKWFPGFPMYEALGKAARLGMDNVIRLLILAGNEVSSLSGSASLSMLMSKMKIT
jgi:hypothetical protein